MPAIAQNEAAALAALEATGVPAPRLLGASPEGAETEGVAVAAHDPSARPCLVDT